MKRRICAMICVICLLVSFAPAAFAASDISGHWAQSDMETLSGLGIMKGYTDGTFRPNNSITKAEYITLLNRTFGLTATQSISASDLSSSKWYYSEIQKAAAAGYLFTFGGKVKPDEELTREEAAAMFGRLLGLSTSTEKTSFSDDASISSWAKPYIPAVAAAKIISGYPDGSFHPTETITRAEVCRVLMNVCGNFCSTAGTYTTIDASKGNVTVQASGVTLSGLNITGNLYITNAVGTGTVTLNNCTVGGEIIAIGNPGATVLFTGTTVKASVDADGLQVVVGGTVSELTVSADTNASAAVTVSSEGVLKTLHMQSAGVISGAVGELDVQAAGVKTLQLPEKWTIPSGLSATLAGTVYTTSGTRGPGFAAGYPKSEVRQSSDGQTQEIVVTIKLEETANVYCIVVPYGSAAPTDEQVKAMKNYGMVAVTGYNFAAVSTPNVELNLTIKDLPLSGSYDIYLVAESWGSEAKLGSAVKLSPDVQLFAADYPRVSGLGDTSASVRIKTVAAAQVYMMALPAGSAAPTAAQLYAQSGVSGAVYATGAVSGGSETYLTINGLTGGPAAYDLYIAACVAGASGITTDITKFSLASTGNAVTVEYSTAAVSGVYPTYTTLTLRFHDTMYKAGTTTQMGASGAEPADLISITGENLYNGAAVTVSNVSVIDSGSGSVIIAPPSGGWQSGVKYTVSLTNITDASGRSPVPAQISFTVGSGSGVQAPRFARATGSIVEPGESITITTDTPNAVILYTTDGSDPRGSTAVSSYTSSLTLTIPANALNGTQYRIRAVTKLDTVYSEEVDVTYTVGVNVLRPIVTDLATGVELSTSETLAAGTTVKVACKDSAARIHFTMDGSTPSVQSPSFQEWSVKIESPVTLKFLTVNGEKQSEVYTYTFSIAG